jgi:hypothetical protein
VAFGNQRPPLLAAAERELWKALVQINLGSEALKELSSFLTTFANLEEQYAGQDPGLDWYSPEGELPVERILRSFLISFIKSDNQ